MLGALLSVIVHKQSPLAAGPFFHSVQEEGDKQNCALLLVPSPGSVPSGHEEPVDRGAPVSEITEPRPETDAWWTLADGGRGCNAASVVQRLMDRGY